MWVITIFYIFFKIYFRYNFMRSFSHSLNLSIYSNIYAIIFYSNKKKTPFLRNAAMYLYPQTIDLYGISTNALFMRAIIVCSTYRWKYSTMITLISYRTKWKILRNFTAKDVSSYSVLFMSSSLKLLKLNYLMSSLKFFI